MDNNNCCNYNLVALSSTWSILISEQFNKEDLVILSTFFSTLGDNLALLSI